MKTVLIALIAVLVLGVGSIALAGGTQSPTVKGPVMMTDAQLDDVVAAGYGPYGPNPIAGDETKNLYDYGAPGPHGLRPHPRD